MNRQVEKRSLLNRRSSRGKQSDSWIGRWREREIIRILTEFSALLRPDIPAVLESYEFLGKIDFIRVKAFSPYKFQESNLYWKIGSCWIGQPQYIPTPTLIGETW